MMYSHCVVEKHRQSLQSLVQTGDPKDHRHYRGWYNYPVRNWQMIIQTLVYIKTVRYTVHIQHYYMAGSTNGKMKSILRRDYCLEGVANSLSKNTSLAKF